jgi:hypothetical protein
VVVKNTELSKPSQLPRSFTTTKGKRRNCNLKSLELEDQAQARDEIKKTQQQGRDQVTLAAGQKETEKIVLTLQDNQIT